MRASRGFFIAFVFVSALAACGGFLGFGDDESDTPPPGPTADSSADDDPSTADGFGSATDGAASDAAFDAIVSGDAGLDVVDTTPVDAASGALVYATFDNDLTGGDGADTAENMARDKNAVIDGGGSALTLVNRPASLGWTFPAQASLSVLFLLRINALPKGAGGELVRLTGTGEVVSVLVSGNGDFVLRSNGVNSTNSKMTTGVTYLVRVSINANGNGLARAGFTTSGLPLLTESVPWTAGTMGDLQIRTQDPDFAYVVDDVVVTTKNP